VSKFDKIMLAGFLNVGAFFYNLAFFALDGHWYNAAMLPVSLGVAGFCFGVARML
jgi:hypothetical protein